VSKVETSKTCTKCGEIYPATSEYFHADRANADGIRSQCKTCVAIQKRKYYQANKDKEAERTHRYYQAHREEIIERACEYREANGDKIAERQSKYRKANRAEITKRERVYCQANKDKIAKRQHKYYLKYYTANKAEIIQKNCAHKRKKRQTDPMYRLRDIISRGISKSLKGNKNGLHWEDLVGYTLGELREHLEAQFQDSMTWETYGLYGWHIDHIKPISAFEFMHVGDPEFKECWALSNLQPLWAKDNLSKGMKWGNE